MTAQPKLKVYPHCTGQRCFDEEKAGEPLDDRALSRLWQTSSPRHPLMNAENDEDEYDDVLTLPSSTLTALNCFFEEQSVAQQAFAELNARSYGVEIDGSRESGSDSSEFVNDSQVNDNDSNVDAKPELENVAKRSKGEDILVSLKEYKNIFKALRTQEVRLFEYDTRFSVLARDDFVHYDLNEPLSFPSTLKNNLYQSQDIVVVDPPFHDEASQRKLASTVKYILRPEGGCIVLLTGTSLVPHIDDIYRDLPKLSRRNFVIKHDGTGSLATPYACWVGGSTSESDESGFGESET